MESGSRRRRQLLAGRPAVKYNGVDPEIRDVTPLNLLINLPPGFFTTPAAAVAVARFERFGPARRRSHNSADEIAADLAWAQAVIMWAWPTLDGPLLDQAPDLKFVGQIDIGLVAARTALERGLPVSVSRGGFSPAVAEMALGLILSVLRKISDHHRAMRTGGEPWVRAFPEEIDPDERELSGRPVGLIGFGGVGRRLAQLLAPFGGELRVYDPFQSDEAIAAAGGRRAGLDELLTASDVVVVCAANNPGSRKLLGAPQIALLKPGAVLVNVARAALIDTAALLARLRQGDLFAALDVFDTEPLEADSPLRALPNVWLTPHRAGGIWASVARNLGQLESDLEAFVAGRPRQFALTEAMLPGLDG